jgi:acetyl-CoA carboxylase biotin carboxyl carrier protein
MSGVRFDPDAIRTLAGILTETGLTEIEIAEKDSRIRVARASAPAAVSVNGPPPPAVAPAVAATAAPAAAPAIADLSKHPGAVLSPMVGIAYLSPEPGAPPFVSQGQVVTAGQVLLLIEAMKTFNQIKAPIAGTVARVLVATGAPVEYGEPLMIVE